MGELRLERTQLSLKLGPAIRPQHQVGMGSTSRGNRALATLVLLLTGETLSEANHLTFEREDA